MRKPLLIISLLLLASELSAQTTQTIFYTTKEGLPSNTLYRTTLDKKGFLWIATENGLARFDGKKFTTYTTAQGLTDNEIVDLYIDSSNIIWATPFRRSPCFYNEQTDRFENENSNPELKKISLGNTHMSAVLRYGGVLFINNQRNFFVYKNGKTQSYQGVFGLRSGMPYKAVEYQPGKLAFFSDDSIRYFDGTKIFSVTAYNRTIVDIVSLPDRVLVASKNKITVMTIDAEGKLMVTKEKEYPFNIRMFCYTGKRFALGSFSGSTYLVNNNTLDIEEDIPGNMMVRNVREDKDGNKWLSTMESGLEKIQQKRISSYNTLPELLQNFNTLIRFGNSIITGNNKGEIFFYDGLYGLKKIPFADSTKTDAWVRRILPLHDQRIFVSTQTGSYLLNANTKRIETRMEGAANKASKMAIRLNDSILCLGTHSQVVKYNYIQKRVTDSVVKRVISLAKDKNEDVYVGSNEGLYFWKNKHLESLGEKYSSLSFRVNTIAVAPDETVWVGLGTDSLVVLKNNERIASIPLGSLIPGNICKSLYCRRSGDIWLGTNKGLNHIIYQLKDKGLSYNNIYFGIADGLLGEQVNDIFISNDTAYVATSGGINYLPVSLSLPVSEITTFITGVSINNKDEAIKDEYNLRYDENNIVISFAGVDLTGYIPIFQYSLNGGEWQTAEKIPLPELSPGPYRIHIRAIKRDGTPSSQQATIAFFIKTPFWKNSVFWVVLIAVLFIAVIWFMQKRSRQRQKLIVEKISTEKRMTELEMQALMAQINPHFVFNCLNSIKGFVYDKDFKQADKYLDKFSELLRSTMDNAEASIISLEKELTYLDTYLQLEKLRFENKFDYSIVKSDDLDEKKVFVPAMLLQPFVENAIRHGVRHLPGNTGMISISAVKDNDYLVFTIDDNGVGRDKAQELKSERHIEYQSRGMSLSKRRAELYNINYEVIDKKDKAGNALGTKIILRIPFSLK